MKLYLVQEKPGKLDGEYDVADGFVVAAETSVQARQVASTQAGDEGASFWTDAQCSRCTLIGFTAKTKPQVILRSFYAG